ncbi:hypothetical protein RB195_018507 [Necator americanus]|uniref:Uncharacterized protein n=1 Tax=Necator americanus TaxID=51031 RepID=A0ABR1CA31_NECAM
MGLWENIAFSRQTEVTPKPFLAEPTCEIRGCHGLVLAQQKQGVRPLNLHASQGRHKVAFGPGLAPYPPPENASRWAAVIPLSRKIRGSTSFFNSMKELLSRISAGLNISAGDLMINIALVVLTDND